MSWAIVLAVILQMLGPILADWLERLLRRAVQRLAAQGPFPAASPRAILERLFDEARTEYRWYWPPHWPYRLAVTTVEKSLMPHAYKIFEAGQGRCPIPQLPREESLYLESVIGDLS